MAMKVVVQLHANPGEGDRLLGFVHEMMLDTVNREGALGHDVLRDLDDPDKIIVVENWRQRSDHEAYRAWRVQTQSGVAEMSAVLSDRPVVSYCEIVEHA
jgi:quinol monooxygenase YgiN